MLNLFNESTEISLAEHISNMMNFGCKNYLCTDISKDGMLTGPNTELYKNLKIEFPEINIIASGGISGYSDLLKLSKLNLYACVVGKSIYENRITFEELKSFAD